MSRHCVHLRLHTEYSISDGLVRIGPLVESVVAARMPAVAVTDQGNLFAMVKFYKAAEAAGIKPIIGADLWVRSAARPGHRSALVVLCQDTEGYRNLSRLITRSYTDGQHDALPHVEAQWLDECNAGLIALSGGREGDIGQALLAGNATLAYSLAAEWRQRFGDRFYIELQRTGRSHEAEYTDAAVELAAREGLPVVATNDVRFLTAGDYEAHEARVCIHEGRTLADPRRPRRYSDQQYLRSSEEMTALFADLPEAIDNSMLIAQRCNLELSLGKYHLPAFPVPGGGDVNEWLLGEAGRGLERRLALLLDPQAADYAGRRQGYADRLRIELDVITRMGFAGYFLIVADFIRWAKDSGIPVGPGRGSGAGSLVAFSLGITELDPLRYDLLFERFLNPERVSMPDFDVDFCMDRRDEVIHYVAGRYGRDRVSQIITHGTMAAKAVVRDVGRVLGLPYCFVDPIAKLIPFALDMTLDRALKDEPALAGRYRQDDDVRTLIDLALKLEGLTRNAGKHAGGVVIAPAPLTEFMPLYCEHGGAATVTQLDMGDVEAMGLVKFDFLGLRTLTIIDWALRDMNREREQQALAAIDINLLPLDDKPTYDLIRRAETMAIFQLESRGMRDLIRRWQPDTFDDLVALVAMFRPGPLGSGMVDDYIKRKQGARVSYPHPALEPVLRPTYGVIVYQEQVMQIAQVLAGYSLGAADLLRRAMGKKKPEEMAKQRAVFLQGAATRGVAPNVASSIFDLMEKFAEYGFNKSHSAAYALVAYQTAWLKAHHGAAFMAAVLSSEMDNTDKVVALIHDCRRMGISVQRPDINICSYRFTAADSRTIRYGLGAVKGVGQSAVEAITAERDRNGPYRDLFDLCRRLDTRRANRRVLEALLRAGVLDNLGPGRSTLMASLGQAIQIAEQRDRDSGAGQDDLFGAADAGSTGTAAAGFIVTPEWPPEELLLAEKATLGWSPSGHLIDPYEEELVRMNVSRLAELKPGHRRVAGIVEDLRAVVSRRGRMAIVLLDDGTARMEVTVYSELYQRSAESLVKNRLVVVEGDYGEDNFSGESRLVAEKIWDLDQARGEFALSLIMTLDAAQFSNGLVSELKDILDAHRRGACPVVIDYHHGGAQARLRLGADWKVAPSNALLERLRVKVGRHNVLLEY